MARRKLNYREGDWFAVPLRMGGYALGIAARIDKKGGILGYFFRPKYADVPGPKDVGTRHYEDAISVENFGDLGLLDGTWPIVKPAENWNRALWPMPVFCRIDEIGNRAYKVIRDENTLSVVADIRSTFEEAEGLPRDSVAGYGAVEIGLTKMLKDDIAVMPIDSNAGMPIEHEPIEDNDITDDQEQHSVAVYWKLSDDPEEADEEMERLLEVDEKLAEKFQSETLEYDGIERGQGWFIIYFYGKDADAMERKLMPVIKKTKPRARSYLVKGYGNSDREDVRVEPI